MQRRPRAADVLPVPTESAEQQCLFRWAAYNRGRWPEMELMYHIPNGGTRSKSEAGRFRAEGVKPGVPDICLPVARGGYHGMYIEMKRRKGGRVSPQQAAWIDALIHEGYVAVICRGWEEAAREIERYMNADSGGMRGIAGGDDRAAQAGP